MNLPSDVVSGAEPERRVEADRADEAREVPHALDEREREDVAGLADRREFRVVIEVRLLGVPEALAQPFEWVAVLRYGLAEDVTEFPKASTSS